MIPLVDTHVHLLAGLDDGPADPHIALAMTRMLVSEGVGHATALAHQNESYPENTPERLRAAAALLRLQLAKENLPLTVYPTAEVMLMPSILEEWQAGKLLSVADRGQWLLIEMPYRLCINILPFAETFQRLGVRLIIAHAERCPELLDDLAMTARWIAAGCLIQVTAGTLAEPWDANTEKSLKRWATGGFIHLLGSDGHGMDRRRPVMAAGYNRLVKWIGRPAAERIGTHWGLAIFQGLPIVVPELKSPPRSWFTRLFGE